jgi:vacuole morphology and inheritance protein 14
MLINWINVFDTLPNVNFLKFLPTILEDLFNMLTDKNNDIRNAADCCLMEFLKEIRE